MKIDIIVAYVQRYRHGHEKHFVPPITGIHLAALTPAPAPGRVMHQQVRAARPRADADLVAISFFSGFAPRGPIAWRRATGAPASRSSGADPMSTYAPEEALQFFDAILIGEAERNGRFCSPTRARRRCRRSTAVGPLSRWMASRRPAMTCSRIILRRARAPGHARLPVHLLVLHRSHLNPGFRTRPVGRGHARCPVDRFAHSWQRKIVWFWDDNLTVKRPFARELFARMVRCAMVADPGEHGHRERRRAARADGALGLHRHLLRHREPSAPNLCERRRSDRTGASDYAERIAACTLAASASWPGSSRVSTATAESRSRAWRSHCKSSASTCRS